MKDKTKGLYGKFDVTRMDNRDRPGHKHHGCEYFVLDLTHDKYAEPALRAYAASCQEDYPTLAQDLRAKALEMRVLGIAPAFGPEMREMIEKAVAAKLSFAEVDGKVVFINDGQTEDHLDEHEKNACPYCGGSGHKDDCKAIDEFTAKRVRRAAKILNVGVPDSDANLMECIGTVLGGICLQIEKLAQLREFEGHQK